MKERPINLTADEVRAVLAGRKTQKRFVIVWKPRQPGYNLSASALELGHYMTGQPDSGWVLRSRGSGGCWNDRTYPFKCPYSTGDRLWVREKLTRPDGDPWLYAADRQAVMVAREDETAMLTWAHHKEQDYCPSIHMPRWASRISLEVTDVRIQRVQDITAADSEAEGIYKIGHDTIHSQPWVAPGVEMTSACGEKAMDWPCHNTARDAMKTLWDSINLKRGYGWDANPWVTAVTFRWLA